MAVPDAFVSQMKALLGDQSDLLFDVLETPAPASIRLNPQKAGSGCCGPFVAAPVPWSSQGYYLKERPSFTFDPLFHAGHYYVQEAASMFLEQAFRVIVEETKKSQVPIRVLDLCAAPGGKSTLLLSLLPETGLLVANEVVRSRASVLVETVMKWGNPNVVVTQNDPSDFSKLDNFFDVLVVDAPCSGEGMFRKDPESVKEWSPEQVKHCATRQRNILSNSLPCLKPGGFLIYSTCTYNTEEDEAVVAWLQEEWNVEPVAIPVEKDWGVTGSLDKRKSDLPVYRFIPHKTKGEGFFLSVLQKPFQPYEEQLPKRTKHAPLSGIKPFPDSIKAHVCEPDNYVWSTTPKGQLFAIQKRKGDDFARISTQLHVLHAGIRVGEMKGPSFIPHPSLALSIALNKSIVPSCELDLKQSIAYLRGEALVLPDDCSRGWVLALTEGHPLGWMKNIGQRANNSWPAEWRIRSGNPY